MATGFRLYFVNESLLVHRDIFGELYWVLSQGLPYSRQKPYPALVVDSLVSFITRNSFLAGSQGQDYHSCCKETESILNLTDKLVSRGTPSVS